MRPTNSPTSPIAALLRKFGLKATPPRMRVIQILQKSQRPLSAMDIIQGTGAIADQATVYRIVKSLKAKGLIRQIDLRHNHAHYELSSDHEHHHLICVHCGRIEDIHDCGISDTHNLVLKHAKHFANIKEHTLEFYGTCKTCSKKLSAK